MIPKERVVNWCISKDILFNRRKLEANMTSYYRGIKVTRQNNTDKSSAVNKVLNYRGAKYNALKLRKSAKPSSGNYRGVSWSA